MVVCTRYGRGKLAKYTRADFIDSGIEQIQLVRAVPLGDRQISMAIFNPQSKSPTNEGRGQA
ncbi:hypothetical protein IQ219_13605 [Synechocystis sp. LEGE 06083]|uniref:hypothetical protein n=1 Tax=Synechocystis sp. LEGE 06083 TaxID=915336 RepID=UPI001881DA4D|nr:hypothetical protein [Synechocystis sp. LEGE 06083]MBE9196313.1 hypothetical protein [Synechocystis sp. LEGE 06083]